MPNAAGSTTSSYGIRGSVSFRSCCGILATRQRRPVISTGVGFFATSFRLVRGISYPNEGGAISKGRGATVFVSGLGGVSRFIRRRLRLIIYGDPMHDVNA